MDITTTEIYHDDHHTPHGWRRWLFSTNHKDIGVMYIIFAVFAGIVGGLFSLLFRLELAMPGGTFLNHDSSYITCLSQHMQLLWYSL